MNTDDDILMGGFAKLQRVQVNLVLNFESKSFNLFHLILQLFQTDPWLFATQFSKIEIGSFKYSLVLYDGSTLELTIKRSLDVSRQNVNPFLADVMFTQNSLEGGGDPRDPLLFPLCDLFIMATLQPRMELDITPVSTFLVKDTMSYKSLTFNTFLESLQTLLK